MKVSCRRIGHGASLLRFFRKFRKRNKKSRKDLRQAQLRLIAAEIDLSEDPGAWLDRNSTASSAYSDEDIIDALQLLFADRSPALRKLFAKADHAPILSLADAWIALKRSELARTSLSETDYARIESLITLASLGPRMQATFDRLLLNHLIAEGSDAQLVDFVDARSLGSVQSIGLSTALRLVQRLEKCREGDRQLASLLASIDADQVEFNRLKLKNAKLLGGADGKAWPHAVAEADFERTANPDLAADYAARVKPAYDLLRPRMAYMEVRSDPRQRAEIIARLTQSLRDRTPFSIIRLSDGEGYLFSGDGEEDLGDARNRERHWWGCEIDDELRAEIRDAALDAVRHADILGIPSIYRFFRDFSASSTSLDLSVQSRGLVRVLTGLAAMPARAAQLTEDKINVALFAEPASIAALSASARNVVVVSSVLAPTLPEEIGNLPGLKVLNIPTHSYTVTNTRYFVGPTSLPFIYRDTLLHLRECAGPGTLVIVAGGLVGKIFAGEARELGAVAIDIGHVIDDWSGSAHPTLR